MSAADKPAAFDRIDLRCGSHRSNCTPCCRLVAAAGAAPALARIAAMISAGLFGVAAPAPMPEQRAAGFFAAARMSAVPPGSLPPEQSSLCASCRHNIGSDSSVRPQLRRLLQEQQTVAGAQSASASIREPLLPQQPWHESSRGYHLLRALDQSFNPASHQKDAAM